MKSKFRSQNRIFKCFTRIQFAILTIGLFFYEYSFIISNFFCCVQTFCFISPLLLMNISLISIIRAALSLYHLFFVHFALLLAVIRIHSKHALSLSSPSHPLRISTRKCLCTPTPTPMLTFSLSH